MIIALYVDDLLIACSDETVLTKTKSGLSRRFKMKDLSESQIILGMDITRNRQKRTITLCQSRYAQKINGRFSLGSARGQPTPMDPSVDLHDVTAPLTSEPYREVIDSLMYLMVGTRPGLAYCIGRLAKFVEKPTLVHWECVKRVIRYFIQTKNLGLVYSGSAAKARTVYVDTDWAGDNQDCKSMSSFLAMMNGGGSFLVCSSTRSHCTFIG